MPVQFLWAILSESFCQYLLSNFAVLSNFAGRKTHLVALIVIVTVYNREVRCDRLDRRYWDILECSLGQKF